MKFSIRTIVPTDFEVVNNLVTASYPKGASRAAMIERLHQWDNYNPQFEVVAQSSDNGQVIGHSLMIPVQVSGMGNDYQIVSVISISVDPAYQHHAVGQGILHELESRAQLAGYPAVSAIDSGDFFFNSGYVAGENFNLLSTMPVDIYSNLVKQLRDGSLYNKGGKIYYPDEYFGIDHS